MDELYSIRDERGAGPWIGGLTMTLEPSSVERELLRRYIAGAVMTPGDDGYDNARGLWNARIDRHPAAIVRCRDRDDVAAALRIARDHGRAVTVRAGGHHVSGRALGEGALVLDLTPMTGVAVDPAAATVTVEAGATWGVVDHATEPHGLAVPGGQDPNIGVAGLTLGGGVGWLSRQHGLACDNLLAAEVVTANGDRVRASADQHPELFWALRGGGAGFGVVTELTFRAHPVPPRILAGALIAPAERFVEVTRSYRTFMAEAPRTARVLLGSMTLPPARAFPAQLHDARVTALICCHVGDPEAGEAVFAPLRERVAPVADTLRPRAYTAFQRAGSSHWAARTHLRSQYVASPTDAVAATIAEHTLAAPSAGATVFVSPWTGAETDTAPEAMAYPHREPRHHVLVEARWHRPADDDVHTDWVEGLHRALAPHTTGAVEANFLTDDEPPQRVAGAYGANRARLAALRDTWDPERVFGPDRLTQAET